MFRILNYYSKYIFYYVVRKKNVFVYQVRAICTASWMFGVGLKFLDKELTD